jgi:hypothetical protein
MSDSMPDDRVDWDRLLRHLPAFESPDLDTGELGGGVQGDGTIVMPWWQASEGVIEFEQDVYESGAVLWGFDWMPWDEEARQLIDRTGVLRSVDLLACRKLLTTHVRANRFSDGHLAEVIESGHVAAVLRRIAHLVG